MAGYFLYDKNTKTLTPIAGVDKFPADFGTKAKFEAKRDDLPVGTVFTTTDEFEEAKSPKEVYSGALTIPKVDGTSALITLPEIINAKRVLIKLNGNYGERAKLTYILENIEGWGYDTSCYTGAPGYAVSIILSVNFTTGLIKGGSCIATWTFDAPVIEKIFVEY